MSHLNISQIHHHLPTTHNDEDAAQVDAFLAQFILGGVQAARTHLLEVNIPSAGAAGDRARAVGSTNDVVRCDGRYENFSRLVALLDELDAGAKCIARGETLA